MRILLTPQVKLTIQQTTIAEQPLRHLITAVTAAEIQAVATVAATVAVTATAKPHLLRQPLKK